ncbi:MAG: folylpolyglutamate synthase/dihydrofolate synthase family protein [Cytophagales bacterium]|nr:bifunctional folylpolyglutamate synthase/dihydrofolate synthase [Bernardetiaceae bacterium]MDW8210970.1 folylpolyglutamate synthase/dihydrofolate synthase family protein [Cytophagales bacterium]
MESFTNERFQITLDYLYSRLPMYQRVGLKAFKKGLDNIDALCRYLGNPQERYPCLHVAGTNGKGSSSHMLAAILQSAGYRTGLYTSPHLKSFTERIRVNGREASREWIAEWVEKRKPLIEEINPSFFELTVAMAFDYFAHHQVEIAVIEVGLGGRFDSTNIIRPLLSLITNISYDHQDVLGSTLPEIAFEKAGIIKPFTPVVISQRQEEVSSVFIRRATEENAPLYFASDYYRVEIIGNGIFDIYRQDKLHMSAVKCQLMGQYQSKNIAGVMQVIECLRQRGWQISPEAIYKGLAEVSSITGLKGRWQVIRSQPLTVCDIAHNEDGLRQVIAQLRSVPYHHLHFVFGVVADKSLDKILPLLPLQATYYFCKPNLPRGLPAEILSQQAAGYGLKGQVYASVQEAYRAALAAACPCDMVLVSGSTFVVAEIEDL